MGGSREVTGRTHSKATACNSWSAGSAALSLAVRAPRRVHGACALIGGKHVTPPRRAERLGEDKQKGRKPSAIGPRQKAVQKNHKVTRTLRPASTCGLLSRSSQNRCEAFTVMDESVVFRMSAFSAQGGRKYMEDVVEIRIEYEPTAPTVEDEPKSQKHDEAEAAVEDAAVEITESTTTGGGGGAEPGAEPGPVSAMWVESLPGEDNGSGDAQPAADGTTSEHAVDTRKSVAFFAVFDGHGGREAAHFAREHLWGLLKKQRGFWSKDDGEVCAALRKGFIACHHAMWKELRKLCVMRLGRDRKHNQTDKNTRDGVSEISGPGEDDLLRRVM